MQPRDLFQQALRGLQCAEVGEAGTVHNPATTALPWGALQTQRCSAPLVLGWCGHLFGFCLFFNSQRNCNKQQGLRIMSVI